jgi:hypothetical protein
MPGGSNTPASIRRFRTNLHPIIRFAITGVANTVVGFSVLLTALWLGFGDLQANLAGYAVGLLLGFVANRQWTFSVEGKVRFAEIGRYLIGFGFAWSLNFAVVVVGIRAGYAGSPLIHLAGIAVYSVAFYFLSQRFVFGRR